MRRSATAATATVIAVAVLVAGILVVARSDRSNRKGNGPVGTELGSAPTAPPGLGAPPQPATPPAPAPPPPEFSLSLERLVSQSPAGCLVVASGDKVLYEANPDAALRPASVVKVLTAIAAVDILGAGSRFRTEVRSASPAQDGVIAADLVLVGGGDPTIGTRAWAAQRTRPPSPVTLLDDLADRVASGVKVVKGRVVGLDDRYDLRRYAKGTPQRLIRDGEIGPVAALTVNDGFRVWGHPGVPFDDPVAGAAEVFAQLLRERGVVVEEGDSGSGSAVRRHVVSSIESATVAEITAGMVRESDNESAELLVKAMGHRRGAGTTDAGIGAAVDALRKRGLPLEGLVYADGSGLSATNRVTCRLLVAALQTDVAVLSDGLPVAAVTGTLTTRFRASPAAGRLRAKTGSLDGVAALAGFAENPAGTLTFAWVANEVPNARTGRRLQDLVGEALVSGS